MFMMLVTVVFSGLLVNIWMYYSRGSSCCDEVRTLLSCDPTPAPFRGFVGDCGDIPDQFQGMLFVDPLSQPQCVPTNPVQDYYCTAFPDDENQLDAILVGLIAIAIALPVAIFCQSFFELSNEVDTPGTWLAFDGGGFPLRFIPSIAGLHQDWHFTRDGPGTQPSRFVRWYMRYYLNGEQLIITILNLVRRLLFTLRGKPPPWEEQLEEEGDRGSHASSEERAAAAAEARAEAIKKRLIASAGVAGITLAWVIMAWFVFAYGLLIYNTLGASAEQQFTRSWGISYAMDNATEWQDIAKEALRGIIILAILERLMLTRHSSWLDEHVDFYSVQALLFQEKVVSYWKQVMLFFQFQKRLVEE
jgi:hypothetical protein